MAIERLAVVGAGQMGSGIAQVAAQAGMQVVEYTGGSTGSSLAFVCAVKGYPLVLVMPATGVQLVPPSVEI